MKNIFKENTGKDLKYIGGYIEYALPLSVYNNFCPQMLLDTYGEGNPWVSSDKIKENGAIIMTRNIELLPIHVERLIPYSNVKISEIKGYLYKIRNKFGKEREYLIHYVIVYPENHK